MDCVPTGHLPTTIGFPFAVFDVIDSYTGVDTGRRREATTVVARSIPLARREPTLAFAIGDGSKGAVRVGYWLEARQGKSTTSQCLPIYSQCCG